MRVLGLIDCVDGVQLAVRHGLADVSVLDRPVTGLLTLVVVHRFGSWNTERSVWVIRLEVRVDDRPQDQLVWFRRQARYLANAQRIGNRGRIGADYDRALVLWRCV